MKKIPRIILFICLMLACQTSFAAKGIMIGDSLQTKQYLQQLYNHKISKSDFKLSQEQFIDRYAYNSEAENLIHYYFDKREKKKVKQMNWGEFLLDNFIYSLFNFGWYIGMYQALFVVFAALFFVSVLAIALSVLFLIFISVMLINLYKLINFSRRKLLVELIEMANKKS